MVTNTSVLLECKICFTDLAFFFLAWRLVLSVGNTKFMYFFNFIPSVSDIIKEDYNAKITFSSFTS